MGTTWYAVDPSSNQGSVTFGGVGLLSTDGKALIGTADGTLPGSLSVQLNGQQPGGGGAQSGAVMLTADGTITIPPEVSAAVGQVFTEDRIAEFLATVSEGTSGMFGLLLSGTARAFSIGALQVSGGQDVRVFTSGTSLAATFTGPIVVAPAGSLAVRGSFSRVNFLSNVDVQVDASILISVNDGAEATPADSALTLHGAATIGERSMMVIRASVVTVSFGSRISVSAAATVALTLTAEAAMFEGSVDTDADSSLSIDGTVGILTFLTGLHTGGTTVIQSSSPHSVAVAMGTTWYAVDPSSNRGSVTFVDVGLLSTDGLTMIGTVDGVLPGAVQVELNGLEPGGDGLPHRAAVLLGPDGMITIPPSVSAAVGSVFTDDRIVEFVAAVNAGSVGMYGLQLSRDDQQFTVDGLHVSSGQDARIFAATTSSTLSFTGEPTLKVDEGGSLTITGTFALFTADIMVSVTVERTMFGSGVVVSLADGAAQTLSETPASVPTVDHPLGGSWSFVIEDMTAISDWALGDSDVALNVCLDGDAVSAGASGCNGGSGCSNTVVIPADNELVASCNKPGVAELCQVRDRLEIGVQNSNRIDHASVTLHRLRFADLRTSGPPTTGNNAGGGAIEFHGGSLTIISCAFERNSVPYDSVGGGAISARPGTRFDSFGQRLHVERRRVQPALDHDRRSSVHKRQRSVDSVGLQVCFEPCCWKWWRDRPRWDLDQRCDHYDHDLRVQSQ